MSDSEVVNKDAEIAGEPVAIATDETQSQAEVGMVPGTAGEKLLVTLRELSKPAEGAGEMELMLATLAMAVEGTVGKELPAYQERGEIDEFLLALCRFLALHRSDEVKELLVVELPRREKHAANPLPHGTLLKALDDAADAMSTATSPLW
jgi:hypothetical protein